jgi:hypothetical protein
VRPYLENTQYTKSRTGGVTQVVEHLPRKHKALYQTPVPLKRNKQTLLFSELKNSAESLWWLVRANFGEIYN